MASRGYGESGIGAEVSIGEGVIGTAARDRQVLRFSSLDADLEYGRAIRREAAGGHECQDIPLPGLPDARSVLAIPLTLGDRLVGVLVRRGPRSDAVRRMARGLSGDHRQPDRARHRPHVDGSGYRAGANVRVKAKEANKPAASRKTRTLTYYRKDEAIFVDGEYLIRNIPARILWKLLDESKRTGRTEFTNRELRLDESLGLPPVKDNFESRLILLRHRLREKCPDVRIVSTGRGRFSLQMDAAIDTVER